MCFFFETRSSIYAPTNNPYFKYVKRIVLPIQFFLFKSYRYVQDEVRKVSKHLRRSDLLNDITDQIAHLVSETLSILILSLLLLENFKKKSECKSMPMRFLFLGTMNFHLSKARQTSYNVQKQKAIFSLVP